MDDGMDEGWRESNQQRFDQEPGPNASDEMNQTHEATGTNETINLGPASSPPEEVGATDATSASGAGGASQFTGAEQPAPAPHVESAGAPQGEHPSASADERGDQGARAEAEAGNAAEEPSAEPRLRIEIELVTGDLTIIGGASRIRVTSDDEEQHVPSDGSPLTGGYVRLADLPDDAELRVPDGCEIVVRHVEGDLSAERLDALLIVRSVEGDVELDRVAVVDLGSVDGSVSAARGGSLRLGTVSSDVRVDDYDDAVILNSVAGDVRLQYAREVAVRDGIGGDVTIEHVGQATLTGAGGDAHIERVDQVRIRNIGGDARLEEVNQALLQNIGGDLKATELAGALDVSSIGGDVRLRGVRGAVHLGSAGGDLDAQQVPGGLVAGHVGGDLVIDTRLGAGAEYDVHAGGDIVLRARGEVSARFVAQTLGGEIRTRLPLTVERGRRRNLVGVLGSGSATVTLRSDGGDILITGGDKDGRDRDMSDETETNTTAESNTNASGGTSGGTSDTRTWEGRFGGQRFRVHMHRGPDRAGLHFEGPLPEDETEAARTSPRDFGIDWERGQGARAYGEYEQRLRDLGERAEEMARQVADQAQQYAEKAARRARETDWEAVGRDVRNAVEKAMAELESAFSSARGEFDRRTGGGTTGTQQRPNAQRVRIEQDDTTTSGAGAPFGGTFTHADQATDASEREVRRRDILEQLRIGAISIEEAERRLNELK